MASKSSLLGLMNQLQSLESSMAVILMESAMKISSLTDANIFLLVETSTGRRFCGARHLCDAYARSSLSPIGNDVEMDVNVATTGVSERRIITPSADKGGGNDGYQPFFEDSTDPNATGAGSDLSGDDLSAAPDSISPRRRRHRRRPGLPSQSPRRFQKDLAMDVKVETTEEDLDAETGLLMRRTKALTPAFDGDCVEDDDDVICDNYLPTPLGVAAAGAGAEIHAVVQSIDFDESDFARHRLDVNADFVCGADAAAVMDDGIGDPFYDNHHNQWNENYSSQTQLPPMHHLHRSPLQSTRGFGKRGRSRSSKQRSPVSKAVVPYQPPHPGQLNNVGGWDLGAFLSSNPKIQALQQIRDDSIAEKHSTSNRLLHSVLYTVGRAIAENCAIKNKKAVEAKMFFNKIFELWWSQFPFLQELNNKGVKLQKGKKMLPLRGSVRETMQRYFGNTLDKVLQDMEHKRQYSGHMQSLSQDLNHLPPNANSLHNDSNLGLTSM